MSAHQPGGEAFVYEGFSTPNGTIVPDDVFDVLAPRLSEAELRVLLYIIRRTFGFKKEADTISLRQMVEGITTRDGRVLDRGAGVAKSAAVRAIKGLTAKGIVTATRNQSAARGHEATTYQLRFRAAPLSSKETRGGPRGGQALVLHEDTQQTDRQQTEEGSDFIADLQRLGVGRAAARRLIERAPAPALRAHLARLAALPPGTAPRTGRAVVAWLETALAAADTPAAGGGAATLEATGAPAAGGDGSAGATAAEMGARWEALRARAAGRRLPGTGLTAGAAWQLTLAALDRAPGGGDHRAWTRNTALLACAGEAALVVAPTRIQAQWLTERHDEAIRQALGGVLGRAVRCRYLVPADLGDLLAEMEASAAPTPGEA